MSQDKGKVARSRSRRQKRDLAKTGMLGAMGVLVLTGMRRAPGSRALHVWAGVALLGFTYWHSRLYAGECRDDRG